MPASIRDYYYYWAIDSLINRIINMHVFTHSIYFIIQTKIHWPDRIALLIPRRRRARIITLNSIMDFEMRIKGNLNGIWIQFYWYFLMSFVRIKWFYERKMEWFSISLEMIQRREQRMKFQFREKELLTWVL